MGLFSRKEQWERTFRLRNHHTVAKGFLSAVFWLWGVAGLLFNAGTLFGLTGNVGVGTSSYLSATRPLEPARTRPHGKSRSAVQPHCGQFPDQEKIGAWC